MATVFEIKKELDKYFPFTEAEPWDNSGILVEGDREVTRILVALDATIPAIKEAKGFGAELIITHHPVIFNPLKALCESEPAVLALKSNISVLSAHTNFDISEFGADAHLKKLLSEKAGFKADSVLDVTHTEPTPHGFGYVGTLDKDYSCSEFAELLKEVFCCDSLRLVPTERNIRKIAYCSGAGGEYLKKAIALGCDAYITADVKHSAFTEALNAEIALYAPTHYQMEKPAMENLAKLVFSLFPETDVLLSNLETEPTIVL
ncbi:MAG: Nif3-like dinuclear metal center hexameric protein [Oscillospiraceae bacterium]|nr:Nif3-like dinuclear metal center hexameric protein [Oscillospiraceae bacterium]